MTETIQVFGMELPIMAKLSDGWVLAAHPNGPAIADENSVAVIWIESVESQKERRRDGKLFDDEEEDPHGVPEEIRAEAVEQYEKLTWPLIRETWFPDTESEDRALTLAPD